MADDISYGDCSLVADIGGTNTRVAMARGVDLLPKTIRKFNNAEYPGLEAVLLAYLDWLGVTSCAAACVAVAGPVRDGVAELTNLDWRIDSQSLVAATSSTKVSILNDLQAQGHAISHLSAANLREILHVPNTPPSATRLVVGVGTGFNSAAVYATSGGLLIPPAETGHSGLPTRTDEEIAYVQYLQSTQGFPSIEDALSGPGLERIYAWLGAEAGDPSSASSAEIVHGFETGQDKRAIRSAKIFVGILGAVTGNLALHVLPFGGIYFSGGMTRAFAPYLQDLGFEAAFKDKGRFSEIQEDFGVQVIEDDFAALTGCASHLMELA